MFAKLIEKCKRNSLRNDKEIENILKLNSVREEGKSIKDLQCFSLEIKQKIKEIIMNI